MTLHLMETIIILHGNLINLTRMLFSDDFCNNLLFSFFNENLKYLIHSFFSVKKNVTKTHLKNTVK